MTKPDKKKLNSLILKAFLTVCVLVFYFLKCVFTPDGDMEEDLA